MVLPARPDRRFRRRRGGVHARAARKYGLWGAFILTFVTAVGGGTLRDVLVGGDRDPPFIFVYPVCLYLRSSSAERSSRRGLRTYPLGCATA